MTALAELAVPSALPAESTASSCHAPSPICGASCTGRVQLTPENALIDRPQRFDRRAEMAVDGDIGDPFDVMAECLDFEVALAVVVGRQPPTVPREVVNLDEEAHVRKPEVRVDDAARGNLQPDLTDEAWEPASAKRSF